jgi:hypothetical protein
VIRQKTCFDCLHCKVSVKSTDKCRLCFCSENKTKANHKDNYWLSKPLCKLFSDMSEITKVNLYFPLLHIRRHPISREII